MCIRDRVAPAKKVVAPAKKAVPAKKVAAPVKKVVAPKPEKVKKEKPVKEPKVKKEKAAKVVVKKGPSVTTVNKILKSIVNNSSGTPVHPVSYTHLDVYKRQA